MNSPAYVQRQLDNKFRDMHLFIRAYIDDMIIFSDTLEDHLEHLDRVLNRLRELNICLSPTKAFIGFPSVIMLGVRVDSFGLTTPEEKLKAIANLEFPRTLQQLETYLGLTGWMRQYIERYAQIPEPLQERKRLMAKAGPNAGKARKQFAQIIRATSPSPAEYESYCLIQQAFRDPTMLVHFDRKRTLFIDLDAAKGDTRFGAIVYHVVGDLSYLKDGKMVPPPRSMIQPIMFLSRLLN
jgi:Reverse transcriptase (RNA-dependent DNA polymerase)